MRDESSGRREYDRGLVEAALFLSDKPLGRRRLAKILHSDSLSYVDSLLDELSAEFSSPDRGIELSFEDGRAVLQVKRKYVDAVAHLAPDQDIPRPVLRTLAMIAYNHPMTQADLVRARGNKAYKQVQELIARGLIRAEKHKRTPLLHVTDEFLRYFGLKGVEELHPQAAAEDGDDQGQMMHDKE